MVGPADDRACAPRARRHKSQRKEFVAASRAAQRRTQFFRRLALLTIPVLLIAGYVGVQIAARRKLERQVSDLVRQASDVLGEASRMNAETNRLRGEAFASSIPSTKTMGKSCGRRLVKRGQSRQSVLPRLAGSRVGADARHESQRRRERLAEALYQRAVNAVGIINDRSVMN